MRRFSRRAGCLIGTVAVLGATLPGAAVASTPPPTLTGAFLTAFINYVPSATVDIVADCDPSGTSTVSWSASGDSTALFGPAPYPGTFVETGTATLGPQDGSRGYVNGIALGSPLSVEVFFSIDSPVGQVIGTKRMTASTAFKQGACRDLVDFQIPGGPLATGTYRRVNAQWGTYDAVIVTGDEAYLDSGEADTFLEHYAGTGMAEVDSVQGSFRSSQDYVVPAPGGRATGGGRVGDVTFGFTANRDKTGTKGRCAVVDVPSETTVKCVDVLSVTVSDNRATVYGNALFGETSVRYQMEVKDLEESGAGADTWSIRLSNGYTTGGTLTEGNIQVHG